MSDLECMYRDEDYYYVYGGSDVTLEVVWVVLI